MTNDINYDSFALYVVDTETTGFDPKTQDVIEISLIRLLNKIDGTFNQEQETYFLRAMNEATISDEALAINGHLRAEILGLTEVGKNKYLLPQDVIPNIENWIMDDGFSSLDRIFIGQNPNFDIGFLQETWSRINSMGTFPFSLEKGNRILDTKQLVAFLDICIGKRRLNFNLGSLVKSFGVKKGKAHMASEDTRMTGDLLIKIVSGMRAAAKEHFSDCYGGDE